MADLAVMDELRLGTTALGELFLCLAKYDYHQNQKLIPLPRRVRYTMRRGIWLHACLQHFYEGADWHKVIDALVEWAERNQVSQETIDKAVLEVTQLMVDYIAYWSKEEKWTPIAAEKSMDISFPEIGLTLAPTIDCLAVWKGEYWLVEYKSTSQIPGPLWRAIDPQTAVQWVAVERKLGIRIAGVVFDYIYTKAPTVPRIKKGTKTEPPGFYANTSVTSSRMFGHGVEALRVEWEAWKQAPLENWDVETLRLFSDYAAAQRTKLVNDSKFFVRQISKRPEHQMLGTLRDIRVKVEEARVAQRLGHWPRSFNQKICTVFCDYQELCVQEYMSGQTSQVIREEMFTHDTGEREGRIELITPTGETIVLDEAWDSNEEDGGEVY